MMKDTNPAAPTVRMRICAVADDWFYAHEEQVLALIRQRAIELKA